jgi:hypothetical protein
MIVLLVACIADVLCRDRMPPDSSERTIMPNARAALALMLLVCGTAAMAQPAKTAKERLTDKAADEQRVDNCGVAPERRGPTPRPGCRAPEVPQPAPSPPGRTEAR